MNLRERALRHLPIYVRSAGGFGNRLFAISFAHGLQSKTGRKIRIDIKGASTFIENAVDDCPHLYKDRFGIGRKLLLLKLFLGKLGIRDNTRFYHVYSDSFEYVKIQELSSKIYISGFYQNAGYVMDLDLDWFLELEKLLDDTTVLPIENIEIVDSLAMHIRRGDLLTNGESRGVLDLAYFWRYSRDFKGPSIVMTDADGLELAEIRSKFPDSEVIGQELPVEGAYALMIRAEELVPSNSTLSWFASLHRLKRGKLPGKMPYPFFEFGPPSQDALGVEHLGSNRATFKQV
jgi:hypothetical protein